MRTPFRKRLRVLALGLPGSRFTTHAITCWADHFWHTFCLLPPENTPSLSKHAHSGSARKSDADEVASPTRTSWRGTGALPFAPCGSDGFLLSAITTSNMYRPAFRPTLARAPARRYWSPPSDKVINTLPNVDGTTFRVVSSVRKATGSLIFGLLSARASSSNSLGASSTTGFSSSPSFLSAGSASPVFAFFAAGSAMSLRGGAARMAVCRQPGR
mmetsp:Transcript_38812/g.88118  ORF Transcript_38812/g.88118 Transcript_38812/m.88118 type:complete len:215 (-) Transcript_38812:58-702(-)